MDSAEPQYTTPPERPTSVTVIAIIAIVLGALGILCCTPMGIMPYMSEVGGPNPIVQINKGTPLLFAWTMFQLVVNFVLSVVLLVAGIGSLSLKNWARLLLIAQAAISLLLGIVGTIVAAIAYLPVFREMEGPAFGFGVGGMACGLLLTLGVNGAILYFMTRPNVKTAFGA